MQELTPYCLDAAHPLVLAQEEALLCAPTVHQVGPYRGYRHMHDFTVSVHGRALAVLGQAAAMGSRLYELMRIERPGDILNYLTVELTAVDADVQKQVDAWHCADFMRRRSGTTCSSLPLTAFDGLFWLCGDDTEPQARAWVEYRQQPHWRTLTEEWLAIVRMWQQRLRQSTDFLTQHELSLLDARTHRRDYQAAIERQYRLTLDRPPNAFPAEMLARMLALIDQYQVKSVSFCENDRPAWRALTAIQVRRAQATGVPPQEALHLSGPDSGISILPADWGAEVHIPYEGACLAQMFVLPHWRAFVPQNAHQTLTAGLTAWTETPCDFLIARRDFGELPCATRESIGGWYLYCTHAALSAPTPHGNS